MGPAIICDIAPLLVLTIYIPLGESIACFERSAVYHNKPPICVVVVAGYKTRDTPDGLPSRPGTGVPLSYVFIIRPSDKDGNPVFAFWS